MGAIGWFFFFFFLIRCFILGGKRQENSDLVQGSYLSSFYTCKNVYTFKD